MKKPALVIVSILIISFLLPHCTTNTSPEFIITEFNKVVGDCDSSICIDIHLKYHIMEESSEASSVFNPLIEDRVFSKMGYEEEGSYKTKDEWVERLIKDFEAFKKEFPDALTGGYHQETETKITYKDDEVVSILIDSYIYAGGAHGMHYKEFLNINPNTGDEIDILDRINSKDKFSVLVEEKLRKYLEMGPADRWSDFTLIDEFTMPQNIGFTENGILLIYNEYEILPYAEGLVEISIQNAEMSEFLN